MSVPGVGDHSIQSPFPIYFVFLLDFTVHMATCLISVFLTIKEAEHKAKFYVCLVAWVFIS